MSLAMGKNINSEYGVRSDLREDGTQDYYV